jgi:Protein of unknown function (DUF2510)
MFIGFGPVGLILMIPALILMFNQNWASRVQARHGVDVWLIFMIFILVVDILVGGLIFAAIQGALIIAHVTRRNNARRMAQQPQPQPQPGGWYQDPSGPVGAQRFHDGQQWTPWTRNRIDHH